MYAIMIRFFFSVYPIFTHQYFIFNIEEMGIGHDLGMELRLDMGLGMVIGMSLMLSIGLGIELGIARGRTWEWG